MSDSRLFKILYYLLDKEHTTAAELADKFEVSQRTIYRDVEALSSAGIPVYTEAGRNGGICLLHEFILDRAMLSAEEKQDILTTLQSMSATGYASKDEMLTKLSALFQINMGNWLEIDFSRWEKCSLDNEKFELLKTAVIQHKETEIVYVDTNGEKSKRIIQPLKLSYKSKEWYMKAFCLTKQDFRMFKLNRILEAKLSERIFIPKSFPILENYTEQTYPKIVLLFSNKIAYRVYDEFDETQIIHQKNGDLLVNAEMPIDTWLIGYLLSFGTQVEIIKPDDLRKILAKEAHAIFQKYSNT